MSDFQAASYPQRRYAWYIVAVLNLAYLSGALNIRILTLLIEPLRADFQINDTQVGLLIGVGFAMVRGVAGIPMGRLADNWSRKAILTGALVVWNLFAVLGGLARSYMQLFLTRIGIGIGLAGLSPAAVSLISDYFPPQKRGLAVSIILTGNRLGGGLALLLGGLLLGVGDVGMGYIGLDGLAPWQRTLLLAGIPGFLVALLMACTVREPVRMEDHPSGPETMEPPPVTLETFFQYIQANLKTVLYLGTGVALFFIANIGTAFWVPSFLIRTYGWTAAQAGFAFGWVLLIFSTLGSLCGGYLSSYLSRQGYRDANLRVLLYAVVILLPCRIAYPLMPTGNSALIFLAAALFLVSLPLGTIPAALQNMFPNRMRALTMGFYNAIIYMVGMGLGPVLFAMVTDYMFQDPQALRYALLSLSTTLTLITIVLVRNAMQPFMESKQYVVRWTPPAS